MQMTVISVYDLSIMYGHEFPGIIEGHMEEKIFYTASWITYADSLKTFATQDLLESYVSDVIGIRVMYIYVDERIVLNSRIMGEKMISIIHELVLNGVAIILKEKRFSAFNSRKYGHYGNFNEM